MTVLVALCVFLSSLMGAGGGWVAERGVADAGMRDAAGAFLSSLRPELRERVSLSFDDTNRLDWHYVPRARRGVSLKDMNEEERAAAHDLLRAGLSTRGYLKAVTVIALEDVLRRMAEARGRRADYRDPGLYFVTVFGDPGGEEPWGWRFEGHHLSLQFTSAAGEVAVTPMFYGSNPARVREGPSAGLGVLVDEELLARRLLGSLDAAQREAGVRASDVPGDILLSPGAAVDRLDTNTGVAYADMSEAQRAIVESLLEVWTGNLEPGLAEAQSARMRAAGLDGVRFLWIGSDLPGRPHYYRLSGPSFVIEYDNTQDGANHIHTVWRDPERDFGADLLAEHLHGHHADDE